MKDGKCNIDVTLNMFAWSGGFAAVVGDKRGDFQKVFLGYRSGLFRSCTAQLFQSEKLCRGLRSKASIRL